MKKKALSLLLALVMAFSILPASAGAADFDAGEAPPPARTLSDADNPPDADALRLERGNSLEADFALPRGEAMESGDAVARLANVTGGPCGDNVSWKFENETLTISGKGPTADYETYTPWADLVPSIKTIVVEDGVTELGVGLFATLYEVTSVSLPASVTKLGYGTFHTCDGLKSVTISGNNVEIGVAAFYNCISLEELVVTGSVSSIGDAAFGLSSAFVSSGYVIPLKRVVLPGEEIKIGDLAFSGCMNMETLEFPGSVSSIGKSAFELCTSLKSLSIKGSHLTIGEEAFQDCLDLEEVNFSGSVSNIGKDAFSLAEELADDNYRMALKRASFAGENISVGENAFSLCMNLESVQFQGTVSVIGRNAFRQCFKLDMKIPDGLTEIGNLAFFSCTSLKEAILPGTLLRIGQGAFYRCYALENASVPQGIRAIYDGVFRECTALKSVSIPLSVTLIGPEAFKDCDALKTVLYAGSRAQWERIEIGTDNDPLTIEKVKFTSNVSDFSYNLEHLEVLLNQEDIVNSEYAIPVEDNPFFPYQLQITYQGKSQSYWFADENDSVTVGGCTFRLRFSGKAQHLRFNVSGKTVVAFPDEKEFDNNGLDIAAAGALNIRFLYVNLRDRLWPELRSVSLERSDDSTVWYDLFTSSAIAWDRFVKFNDGDKLDFSKSRYDEWLYRFVVGSNPVNNPNNRSYVLGFLLPSIEEKRDANGLLHFDLYRDGDARQAVNVVANAYLEPDSDSISAPYGNSYALIINDKSFDFDESAWLSMDFSTEELRARENLNVTVYEGAYDNEAAARAAGAKDITAQVWRQQDMAHTGGFPGHYRSPVNAPRFTVIFKDGSSVIDVMRFYVMTTRLLVTISTREDYLYAGSDSWREYAAGQISYANPGGEEVEFTYGLYDADASAQGKYYLSLWAHHSGQTSEEQNADRYGVQQIQKAALGRLTPEQFETAEDIKSALFSDPSAPGSGYLADFSRGDVVITFRDALSDSLRYVTFHLRAYDAEADVIDPPAVGYRADQYFRVESADNPSHTEPRLLWVADYRDDSYYYNGYQTIFQIYGNYLDSGFRPAPVSQGETIYPRFYYNPAAKMYASADTVSGSEQVSGETAAELHYDKPIQYSAAMGDGTHLKNYWVTFVTPQSNGAQLFVNAASNIDDAHRDKTEKGADGKGLPIREVFLNSVYDNHHDILIANIGNQALTGLSVKLVGSLEDESVAPQNVRLSSEWRLGSGGVETLAPFDDNALFAKSRYGNGCDNMTKIRLEAPEQITGDGSVSGYLIIASANGGSMTVKLTGRVGMPEITTNALDTVKGTNYQAVKYVHYSTFLHTIIL